MSTRELIDRLRKLGVKLNVVDGELKVSAPKGVFTAELREALTHHKAALVDLLSAGDAGVHPTAAAIPKRDQNQPIPLSFAQKRMWFLEEFEGGTSLYNIAWAMRIKGALNKAALEAALNDLVARHESLRTTFVAEDGEPLQIIHDRVELKLDESRLNTGDETALKRKLSDWSTAQFDLRNGPLLKARLIELGPDDHVLMLVIHHIVSDAWSLDVLQREFFNFYFARIAGTDLQLDELPIQFADYALWQQERITPAERKNQLDYWTRQLAGIPPLLELPTDRPRPSEQSYRGARIRRLMPQQLQDKLKKLARLNDATLFMVLLSAFDVLLYRYTGQDDVVVGTPIAGRQRSELEGLIGLFLNTLVMRADVSGDPTFNDLLRQVQTSSMDAFAHQDLPFEKLVDELASERNMSYSPIFQVLFMLQNAPASGQPLEGMEISPVEFDYGTAKFDLTLAAGETPDGLVAEIEYSTDLFDVVTIEHMLEHYEMLLEAISTNPDQAITELSLITSAERQLLNNWNETAADYPAEATLQSLLEQQVAATPAAEALVFADASLTYAKLNTRANQLAHWLIDQGAQPDELIGVCTERSVEMVVALLGIIKAGLAYVPLDPEYPEHRLEHMLDDAAVRIVLTQAGVHAVLPAHDATLLELDSEAAMLAAMPTDNPAPRIEPENLAYTIFTSGSTGRPKGVMNEHRGIVNRLLWMQDEYNLTAADRVLQKTPFSFDVSVWEFFWPLISGATLVVAKPGGHKDPDYLASIIHSAGITTLHFVPSMLQIFLQNGKAAECTSLRQVICSGEALSHDLQTRFYNLLGGAGLHNLYGPTEAAIDVTHWACPRESIVGIVPIGRPVANTQIYIVDAAGHATPIGVPGELWIGGAQVARGYVNRPDLTAERFVTDPFVGDNKARAYRTGDLARYRRDGTIEFLGRIDHQVKLRGFRIELGEIEANLDALPEVKQSLVLLREDRPGHKRLIAYVTTAPGAQPDIPAIRQQLHAELPDYMVPAAFVLLSEFPLMPNGKVNRRALPEPSGVRDVDTEFVPPRTEVEKKLAAIWADLLRADRVGIHDNFFDLGGDSILSIQIITRAAKEGLQLAPKQVFRYQTIAELAETAGTETPINAEQGLVTGTVKFTPVENWFLDLDDTDKHHFNQSIMLEVDGTLSIEIIEQTLRALYRHHDALRLQLVQENGAWVQRLNEFDSRDTLPELARSDVAELASDEQAKTIYDLANESQASISLESNCLLAARYFDRGNDKPALLLLVIHHLAIDGMGWRILLEDMETTARQLMSGDAVQLPTKTSSFKAWTNKLEDYANSTAVEAQLEYWQGVTASNRKLPLDKPDGRNNIGTARTVQIELDEATTTALLQDVPGTYRTRINDVLLTALGRAVGRWTGAETCLVDLEGHGREQLFDDMDVSRTLGWFTSIYPVNLTLVDKGNGGADLKAIKEQLRQIPANGIGYGLLRYTAGCKELQSAQTAEILFNYLGQFDQTFGDAGLFAPAQESGGLDQSPQRLRSHLLDINGSILQGKLRLGITYSKAIHNRSTIQQLADGYTAELRSLIEHCIQADSYGRTPSDFPLCALEQPDVDLLAGNDRNVSDIYPVTPMQHGMLFHDVYEVNRETYLSQVVWKLEGTMDTDAFGKAWQLVVDRHAALRTGIFTTHAGEPLQVVYKQIDVPLHYTDLQKLPEAEREQHIFDFLTADRGEHFAFNSPPLMRLNLYRCTDREYRFIWTFHHIIIDGWSVPIVIGELMDAYQAFADGHTPKLKEARPFGDYVAWLCQQEFGSIEAFWRDNLAGLTAPTALPAALQSYNPALGLGEYAEEGFTLSEETTGQLREFARHQRLTLNTLVQGVWSILLHRYSTDEQVIFGATTSGRPAELKNVESMVGLLINALPIATHVAADQKAIDWLTALQDQQLNARQYESASLVEVQGWSEVPRGTPLFNTLLVFENYPEVSSLWTRRNEALAITDMRPIEWTNYPLMVAVNVANQFCLRLDYDQQFYDLPTVQQIGRHFLALLQAIVTNPELSIGALPMLDATERHHLLTDWNATDRPYPADATLPSLLDAQAAATPDATALVFGAETLTYAELNTRANQLAHWLINQGTQPDDLIGVCMERSIEMVVALLGTVKAGLAYVPLDPDYPEQRLEHMLEDADIKVLLTQSGVQDVLPAHSVPVLLLDEVKLDGQPCDNPPARALPDNLAYVIFTSGSTGRPKGVMNEHRGIVNRLLWMQDEYGLTADDRVLQKTPFSFDVSVWEFFWPLISGATLVVARPGGHKDPSYLAQTIDKESITTLHFVPSMLQVFLQEPTAAECTSLKRVICSGEALSHDLQTRFYKLYDSAGLHNLYGPTEAAIDVTYWACPRDASGGVVPIGRPVANTHIYIVDKTGNPTPVGVPGELWIGGIQVARGYVNRPDLTTERFIHDPFVADDNARVYRTGDLVRYRADGVIEFLGRIDHQVKLRGFRIELGEIETRVEEHAAVNQSLVMLREDNPGDQRLVAYVVASTDNLDREQIEEWEAEQVAQWNDLWQDTYSEQKEVVLGSDFSGWMSSYTAEAIPIPEMEVWITSTARRINALGAARILEIGSGTGLVASRVAPHCDHYLATDFSGAVIETLQKLKDSRSDLDSLELRQSRADELGDLEPGSFDAVIINSVAQYFPDAEYFVSIVKLAIEKLADGGHLFLGDLRDLRLLDTYQSSVQLFKANDSLKVANLASRIRQRIEQEEELLIDPAIFAALKEDEPRVSGMRFLLKDSTELNELTRFRYDVVVEVGGSIEQDQPELIDWQQAQLTLSKLENLLQVSTAGSLLIRSIPDARLAPDVYAMERFGHAADLSVGELRAEIAATDLPEVEPDEIYQLMQAHGWDVQLLAGSTGNFDALCHPAANTPAYDGQQLVIPRGSNWPSYANDPLRGRLARSLESFLRDQIKAGLPEYMMPSAFLFLDEFPLTPNGKIDRNKLPAPEWRPQKEYVAPRTPTEEILEQIWKDVLRVERIGIHDDFFALGGHSLLATQVISRIRDQIGAEPELRMLFKRPTIAEFAPYIDGVDSAGAAGAIEPVPHGDGAILSFAQQRLWFLDKLEGGNTAYNMTWPMRLTGPLDRVALQSALDSLSERHESLRTNFATRDGEGVQVIRDYLTVELAVVDMHTASSKEVGSYLATLAQHRFDLETDPLFATRLIELDEQEHILVILIHHIISDGWSMDVIYRELVALYKAAQIKSAADLPTLPIQYADFSIWQRKMLDSPEFVQQLDYWKLRLRGAPARSELPTDRPRPSVQTYSGATINRPLSAELSRQLRELAQRHSTTLFVLTQTVFATLVARYSAQDDIVIGTPIAGRNRSELEGLIGFFINTLALRTNLEGNPSFETLLAQARDNTVEAYEHQDIPFEKLVDELQPVREMSHSPIFQIMFTMLNPATELEGFPEIRVEPVEFEYKSAKFDLTLFVSDFPDQLGVSIEYNTDLFDQATTERMLGHYEVLLRAVAENPSTHIADLPLLDDTERHHLLTDWNATDRPYPTDATLPSLLDAQAAATPDATALVCGAETLTYAELNARANQLAHWLIAQGTQPDDLIGVCMERSIEMVIALLGTVKAGLAYVPLDPDYPEQRLEHMLEDADIKVLLTQSGVQDVLPAHSVPVLLLDEVKLDGQPCDNPPARALPDNLAYVIFTSGSTGRPKGVMNEHRGIVNRLLWMQDEYGLTADDRVLQKTPFSFDVSVWEFFWPLISGATLVVAKPGGHKDPSYLAQTIDKESITTLHFVPSMLQVFLQEPTAAECTSLKRVICSGEALSHDLQTRFYKLYDSAGLHNLYGPTEAAIDVTYWACPRDASGGVVPIGRPVANTHIYIVDKTGNPTPVGVPGELWIGGIQVARGYVNRPDLTTERFIHDPFVADDNARVYRTGDLVRYRADGVIEFLGRIDHQVKLRGFRIELGEIEASLDALPQIEQSLVLLREDVPGDKRLVAYISSVNNVAPDVADLRRSLQNELPEYMVPGAFVALDIFPLLPNGKVDRKALPQPEWHGDQDYVAPRTPTEKTLADIWTALLNVERVGIHDNFFELGGDSILSIRIIARAAQAGLHLTAKQVFTHQSIAELAEAVGTGVRVTAEQGIVTGDTPLLPIQSWFLQLDSPDPDHFNQSLMLEVDSSVSAETLQQALDTLYQHHDALRLSAAHSEQGWTQTLTAADNPPMLQLTELGDINDAERNALIAEKADQTQAAIRIDSGCLLASRLFLTLDDQPNLLLVAIHHLGVDGVSWGALLEDLETACRQAGSGEGILLPPKTTSYKVWAEKLDSYVASGALDDECDYWQRVIGSATALPIDSPQGINSVVTSCTELVSLDAESTRKLLQDVPAAYQTRINDVLLTALARSLRQWTGSSNYIVDLEGHGREELFDDVDISRTVGWFTSKYPVRLDLADNSSVGDDLKAAKENLRSLPNNGIGYGLLEQHGIINKDNSCKSDIIFNYLGQFDEVFAQAQLLKPAIAPGGKQQGAERIRTHALDINGSIGQGQLNIAISYSNALHDQQNIRRFAESLQQELHAIIDHCISPEAFGRTPSDFSLCELSQPDVDRLTGMDRNVEDIYPATAMQHGMLFHSIYADDHNAYLSQVIWKIEGDLNTEAFAQAWQTVIDRHASLRTGISSSSNGEPVQVAYRKVSIKMNVGDLQNLASEQQEAQLDEFLSADQVTRFNLEHPPLVRLNLFRLSEREFRFVWTFHHTVIDGWSIPVVISELLSAYLAHLQGQAPQLPTPRPYRDYVAWLSSQDRSEAEEFWRATLSGINAPTELPAARTPYDPSAGQGEYQKEFFVLSETDTSTLREFARARRLTMNTLVQGAWSLLLSRYSGSDQVVFGATTSGRPAELKDVESIVGLLINSLPVAIGVDEKDSTIAWLDQLQTQQLAARQYEYASLVEIQGWSAVPRGTPLFNTLLVFENYPAVSSDALLDSNTPSITYLQPVEWTHYPLTAAVMISQQFVLRLDYDQQYYDQKLIGQLGRHFLALLNGIVTHADGALAEIPMLDESERNVLLDWNATEVEYVPEATLPSLLDTQAAATPDATALVCGAETLTYAELNARANQLAHWLIAQGTQPDDLIGVCMERSIEMVIALLGTVKAGLAYVPLDPDYPEQRLEHMLEDADIKVLLTQSGVQDVLPVHSVPVLLLDEVKLDGQPCDNPPARALPDNLAYVIFTSGSTGRPKGVMNEHRGIVNRLLWMQDEYGLTRDDRVLQKTPFSFDVSVWEFFWPLISGATLVVARPGGHKDPSYLAQTIDKESITTLHFVPSMLQVFLQEPTAAECTSLKRVICSGEALSHDLQTRFYKLYDSAGLHNLYGPTEAAIDVTYWACPRDASDKVVPIGRPVANTHIYIVDKLGNSVPVGVPGELWIGGVQVARGYVNRPDLTAERFTPDPFHDDSAARIYKTGDLVRYRADGTIEFLGRIDHQVKLRGFRIELGEIEASLDALPQIEQSLVLLREDTPGDKRLVAYVSGGDQAEPDVTVLRETLQQELPDYMMPGAFVVLDAFPLLPNGKVDRKALPQPDWHGEHDYVAPRSTTELVLAEIWQAVLKVEQVGIHDDFFELGGHSLLATQIVARVRDSLGTAPELRLLFSNPTLEGFAARIEALDKDTKAPPPLVPVPRPEGAPLSFAQQRLWFLDQLEGGGPTYNVATAVRLTGPLDLDALELALNDLVARHESLRTIFGQNNDGTIQIVAPELTLSVIRVDMTGAAENTVAKELTHLSREAFDLSRGPLLRLHTIKTDSDQQIVLLVIHHIVSDAWSLNILFGELMTFYDVRRRGRVADLPALPVQFADFAIWQRNWLSGAELERQLDYWKARLEGAPPAINLPADRPHPPVQKYNGAITSRTLRPELKTRLEALARQHNATLFMTLLAAFNVLLARYSGEDDIVVGTPVSGRNHVEVEGLIGFFLNTLGLRTDLSGNPSFSRLLEQVTYNTLDAYAHQDLPFESLVEALAPPRDLSRSPVFQVLFTLQNAPEADNEFENLRLDAVPFERQTARFELSLGIQAIPEGLLAGFEYNTDLFDRETIEKMFDGFERLLDAIVSNPASPISDLQILQPEERQQLLSTWNATEQAYPSEATLHELFARQVALRPDDEALACAGDSLSYRELDQRANRLAHKLRELGAGPDVLVALGMDRSIDMIVGVLGILKSGAAYVPLDPAYPAERITYMLEDSQAAILVTQAAVIDDMPTADIEVVCIDELSGTAAASDVAPIDTGVTPTNLAYVIYTSGSTGKPKGVQLEHRSVVNFLSSMATQPGFDANDRLLAVTTLCFDISVLEILLPLSVGGTVVVATREESGDGYALRHVLEDAGITVMQATPATWRMLLQSEWTGSPTLKVLCGGEALDRDLADELQHCSSAVWNMYGPTETTIWSSCHRYTPSDPVISIGRPIGNTQMYVLDGHQQLVPAGVSGELYIGGDGLARGYRDRPELNAERFVANPFRQGERMYRTGDLARWLKNGQLQVQGRTDFQVKLRGFRIELGEIEAVIADCDQVDQVVVVLREDTPGDQRLVAYLTSSDSDIDANELREQLYATLPHYMVPSAFMVLDEIPLTPNGKVNRKALPLPEWSAGQEYVAPRNQIEETLAEVWENVLRIEKIGVHDNFFVIGGHSLLATQLVARIRNTMNVELPLMYIFDYPSVASLAVAIDAFGRVNEAPAADIDDEDLEDISI